MENLVSFGISIASGIVFEAAKYMVEPSVEKEIKLAFNSALKKFCKSHLIRDKMRVEIRNVVLPVLTEPSQDLRKTSVSNEYAPFFDLFELELSQKQKAYSYLTAVRDDAKYNELVTLISNGFVEIKESISDFKNEFIQYKKDQSKKANKYAPKLLTNKLFVQDFLVGREKELTQLKHNLFDAKQMVLISGMGGIGKTSLVKKYIKENWKAYDHIAWINCENGIPSGFVNTPELLDNLYIERNDTNKNLFRLILSELKSIELIRPGILILDDVTDLDLYSKYLISLEKWHIIILSRTQFQTVKSTTLNSISEESAINLFNKINTKEILNESNLKKLLKSVEYHPLTIELLANTFSQGDSSLEDLILLFENDNEPSKEAESIDAEKIKSYLSSVFLLHNLSELETDTLKKMICLPSGMHEKNFLVNIWHDQNSEEEELFNDALESLWEKGFLMGDMKKEYFQLHGIVREVICSTVKLEYTDIHNYLKWVLKKLSFGYNNKGNTRYEKLEFMKYGVSVNKIVEHYIYKDALPEKNNVPVLWNDLGLTYQTCGEFEKAYYFIEKAQSVSVKHHGHLDKVTITRTKNLSSVLMNLGKLREANTKLEELVKIVEKKSSYSDKDKSSLYSDYGISLFRLKELDQAERYLRKSLDIATKIYPEDSLIMANRYSNLGLVLTAMESFTSNTEAKTLLTKAFSISESNLGKEHPATTIKYHNLGMSLKKLGELEQAKRIMLEVIEADTKHLGEDHPNVIRSYNNLATILINLDEWKQAKEITEKVLVYDLKKYGENHPDTAVSYSNLSIILRELGLLDESIEMSIKCAQAKEAVYGLHHKTTRLTYYNLCTDYYFLVSYDIDSLERLKILEKGILSLNSAIESEGDAVDLDAICMHYTEMCQFLKQKEKEKEGLLLRLKLRKDYSAEFDDVTLDILRRTGSVFFELQEFEEASTYLRRSVDLGLEHGIYDEHSINAGTDYYFLAKALYLLENPAEARQLAYKALYIFTTHYGDNHKSSKRARNFTMIIKRANN